MLNNLQDEFILSETKAAQLPPLTLAYIGDCIFDLYVRTKHVLGCSKNAGKLHSMSIRLVNAKAQSEFAHRWLERFTEHEREIFMRGRNAKSPSAPKNMSVADYKYATAIEAVIGYLYLSGQAERVNEILGTMEFDL